ncbi:MAG: hypothetical protein EON54_12620, partial [Alcaligenaceae bacterium]
VEGATAQQPAPDGGLRLVARFEVPADAPTHGARRSGDRVDWRVELLDAHGAVELSYALAVQAAPASLGAPLLTEDRFDRRAAWKREEPILLQDGQDSGNAALPWPQGAVVEELPEALQIRFAQQAWRWAALVALVVLAAEWAINERVGAQGVVLPRSLGSVGVTVLLLAFVLHAATRRWTLRVQDDGLVAQRGSWVWSTVKSVPGTAAQGLVHKVLFSTGGGGSERRYHAVYGRNGQGPLVQLTPGLADAKEAIAMGRLMAQTWQGRRGGFAPGASGRRLRPDHSRPAWGAVLIVGLLVGLLSAPRPAPPAGGRSAPSTPAPTHALSAVDARLLDAQDAGNAGALEQALRDRADPNLLAENGSSVLMLAAHRGQLAHVDLLLRAGAQVDLRQTQKDSERGDTALLRAFYGGHLPVAQRLVQAGASLQARNRWDWGPVHMAAQSGCVPCLQWLGEQGQALDELAPASRGETPAMLAAAKGHVEVLKWLENAGVDLLRQDSHGQRAVDWARFGNQPDAARWLMERQR